MFNNIACRRVRIIVDTVRKTVVDFSPTNMRQTATGETGLEAQVR